MFRPQFAGAHAHLGAGWFVGRLRTGSCGVATCPIGAFSGNPPPGSLTPLMSGWTRGVDTGFGCESPMLLLLQVIRRADPSHSWFKTAEMVRNGRYAGCRTSGWRHVPGRWICVPRRSGGTEDIILRAATASPRMATKSGYMGLSSVHRRVTPWRELTRDCSLRPGGASLLAKTGRSEQGGD